MKPHGFHFHTPRYDFLTVLCHWSVFLLVATACAAVELKGMFAKGAPPRMLAMTLHEWAGALVLALAVPRLLWRLARPAPPPAPRAVAMRLLAGVMHVLLYLYIVAQPLLGLVALNAGGHLLELQSLGLTIPPLVAPDEALRQTVKALHETVGTVFYLVIGLHAMAALFHHYMLGDDTLRRMWR